VALLAFLLVCYLVAFIGARITTPEIHTWYARLAKPRFNPANWIFAPVWTTLYTFMAVAAWLVWRVRSSTFRIDALVVFGIQLALNCAWIFAFFQLHRLLVAVVVILALWFAILLTLILFWNIRRTAGALIVPYLAWVSFATALNLALLRLN
jgi:tryptophan-rich sensory protein